MRLKNTCASSTSGEARAASAFPEIQLGTEREARETRWGVLTAVKAHAPLPSHGKTAESSLSSASLCSCTAEASGIRTSHQGSEHFIYSSTLSSPLLIQL